MFQKTVVSGRLRCGTLFKTQAMAYRKEQCAILVNNKAQWVEQERSSFFSSSSSFAYLPCIYHYPPCRGYCSSTVVVHTSGKTPVDEFTWPSAVSESKQVEELGKLEDKYELGSDEDEYDEEEGSPENAEYYSKYDHENGEDNEYGFKGEGKEQQEKLQKGEEEEHDGLIQSEAGGADIHRVYIPPKDRVVAIVGLPNVGKSTLFNRLTAQGRMLTDNVPGTTRDRVYGKCWHLGEQFGVGTTSESQHTGQVVDTGGLAKDASVFSPLIHDQAMAAVSEAEAILFLVDGRQHDFTPYEKSVAVRLRDSGKPITLVVNKCDTDMVIHKVGQDEDSRYRRLGLGQPFPISAFHARGVTDLLDKVMADLGIDTLGRGDHVYQGKIKQKQQWEGEGDADTSSQVRIAIVGRPNVGKSSFLNKVMRQDRLLVSDTPGTTHDTVDEDVLWTRFDGTEVKLTLVDTAGIRRKGTHNSDIERATLLRAIKAINRADVTVLMTNSREGVLQQDKHIAEYILDSSSSVLVACNKWDMMREKRAKYESYVLDHLKFMKYVPIVFTSATTGYGVDQVIEGAIEVHNEKKQRIKTRELHRILERATMLHKPPRKGSKVLKIKHINQNNTVRPTFTIFANEPSLVHFTYERYLENVIRQHYPFRGTPISIFWKKSRGKPRIQKGRK